MRKIILLGLTVAAVAGCAKSEVARVKRFEVVNDQGKVVAVIEPNRDGGASLMLGSKGDPNTVILSSGPKEGGMTVGRELSIANSDGILFSRNGRAEAWPSR